MNKRQRKKLKNKVLNKPMLALREGGMLGGYTCPRCGNRHVKEPYCRNCNQMLIYHESQRNSAPLWKSNDDWESESKKIMQAFDSIDGKKYNEQQDYEMLMKVLNKNGEYDVVSYIQKNIEELKKGMEKPIDITKNISIYVVCPPKACQWQVYVRYKEKNCTNIYNENGVSTDK